MKMKIIKLVIFYNIFYYKNMCYSFNTSIMSYTLGMISGIVALFTNQIVLGMLILCYTQMQLSEALIWKGIDTNNINLNKKGTKYGKYLLATHNIAIGLGIIIAILIQKQKLKWTDYLPLIVGVLFFIFVVTFYYYKKDYPDVTYPVNSCSDKSCQNAENRLKWPYPHEWYIFSYIISLIILLFYIKPNKSKIFLASVFTITLLISMFIYPKSVGSVWCFSTSWLAPIIVLINYFLVNY
jgi:hypothetical protein